MLQYLQKQNNGSARERQLPCTCAGGTSTYTTGIPAPQSHYTLFAPKLQGESAFCVGLPCYLE